MKSFLVMTSAFCLTLLAVLVLVMQMRTSTKISANFVSTYQAYSNESGMFIYHLDLALSTNEINGKNFKTFSEFCVNFFQVQKSAPILKKALIYAHTPLT